MAGKIVIHGGLVVTEEDQFRADVVIDGERIVGLVNDAGDLEADQRIDATGLLVLPGGIDSHTHFEEPDPNLLEGFTTGGAGAAAGGITTVVEMPQAHPTTTSVEHLRAKQAVVAEKAIVDMALWGGIVPEQSPDARRDLAAAGVAGFKSFMAASSPFFPAVDEASLLAAMQAVAGLDMPYALHAENDALLRAGLRRMMEAGRKDPLAHAECRPPIVESVAVNTALHLAEQTGCWVHICHVASSEALRLIGEAKSRGVRVTCETCPQYLALNTDDLVRLAGFARCAPAVRPQEEVDAIWPYVLDGTVNVISSDHCGYTIESKERGKDDIFSAPLGLSGIQTLLPVFFDAAVVQRGMALHQFVRQTSTNAARIFGLYPRKGTVRVGSDADLVLFDPQRSWTVRGEDMHHRHKWTPFEGRRLTGQVVRTVRRGETIYDGSRTGEARVSAIPGSGRFLPRGYGQASA